MRLPRDVSGKQLAILLGRYGYEVMRQTDSHIRLTTTDPRGRAPRHDPPSRFTAGRHAEFCSQRRGRASRHPAADAGGDVVRQVVGYPRPCNSFAKVATRAAPKVPRGH
jgi:hypothetical protein